MSHLRAIFEGGKHVLLMHSVKQFHSDACTAIRTVLLEMNSFVNQQCCVEYLPHGIVALILRQASTNTKGRTSKKRKQANQREAANI